MAAEKGSTEAADEIIEDAIRVLSLAEAMGYLGEDIALDPKA